MCVYYIFCGTCVPFLTSWEFAPRQSALCGALPDPLRHGQRHDARPEVCALCMAKIMFMMFIMFRCRSIYCYTAIEFNIYIYNISLYILKYFKYSSYPAISKSFQLPNTSKYHKWMGRMMAWVICPALAPYFRVAPVRKAAWLAESLAAYASSSANWLPRCYLCVSLVLLVLNVGNGWVAGVLGWWHY